MLPLLLNHLLPLQKCVNLVEVLKSNGNDWEEGKGDPFPKVSDIVAITFEWSRCHSQQNLTYLANFQGEKFLQKNYLTSSTL